MSKLKFSVQEGRVLVLVLIILGLGALLIPAFLSHASTNLFASRATEEGMKEQYAADAGVEYAIAKMMGWGYCKNESFNTPTLVNRMPISVTISLIPDERFCLVTSRAGSTTVTSYVELLGNLKVFDCALASKDDMTLKSSGGEPCVVIGDMYCGDVLDPPDFQPQSEVIQTPLTFPSPDEDMQFAEGYKEEALAGGTFTGTKEITSSCSLGPLYINGDLYIKEEVTINLAGTIYVEGSITAKKEYEVTGSGSIFAVGDIYLSKMSNYGTEGTSIIMSLNGGITFKKDATVAALIYAPNGAIKFDMNATITGGVVGYSIQSDKNSKFILNPVLYDSSKLSGYIPGRARLLTFRINP